MRKMKRYASFALAVCMAASLFAADPVTKVSAAELEKVITSVDDSSTEEIVTSEDENSVEEATGTDAGALDEAQETVYYSADDADADGFVWEETKIVKYIGKGGNVKIPAKCTSIGYGAFEGCSNLTSVKIPEGATSIGVCAFKKCSGLTNIEIPSSVTSIEVASFEGCSSLTSIEIPLGVTSIEESTFEECSSLISIELPSSVTSIGEYAFYRCSGLTSIKMPEGVTSIGYNAFNRCSGLTSIEIPTSVTSIGDYSFEGCSSLTSIVVSPENPKYNSEENCNAIIETETKELILGCKNTKIPSGVMSIGNYAFYGCSDLKNIEIPSSVMSIGEGTFCGCSGLTSIKISEGVTSIGDSAFYRCSGLTSIKIPESVTSIGDYAFSECSGLTSIKIPKGVMSIGGYAFMKCNSLTSIVVSQDNPKYNSEGNCNAIVETGAKELILGCKNTKIPSGVMSIGNYAFYRCSGLTSIEIPSGVMSIGNYAFSECSSLTSIEIPSSVTSIGDWTFCGCSGLTSIEIPTSVTSIGYYAFSECSSLTSIEIPSSVTSIRDGVFMECSSLTSIKISEGVTSIGDKAFKKCRGLTSIEIPPSVTSIEYNAFDYNLTIIYGTPGSYAEEYADKKWYQFVERVTVPTVTNVQAAAAGKNKVKVTWDKVSGATGYIVYARKNGTYAKLGVTAATSYTDTKALDNDYNFYFVYAYKKTAAGNIFTGKCQKYAYAKGTCMAVTNLKASSVKGGVKLTWTKSAGADGYIVYGKKTNFKYGYVGMTTKNTATSYTDTKANKESYNFYWVFPYHYDKNGNRVIGPICGYVYGKAK